MRDIAKILQKVWLGGIVIYKGDSIYKGDEPKI